MPIKFLQTLSETVLQLKKRFLILGLAPLLVIANLDAVGYCCCDLEGSGQCLSGDHKMCATHPDHPFPVSEPAWCAGVSRVGDCPGDAMSSYNHPMGCCWTNCNNLSRWSRGYSCLNKCYF